MGEIPWVVGFALSLPLLVPDDQAKRKLVDSMPGSFFRPIQEASSPGPFLPCHRCISSLVYLAPAAIAEWSLCLWLLLKGAKVQS
jgi:hypothetical protein